MTIQHLGDLTPDSKNARRHNPRNVGMIVDALHEVGAARSIVIDEHGKVLAGNATIEAAAQAGIERVQVVDADGETLVAVRRTGLTEEQKVRLALYDNRTAELADWDPEILTGIMADDGALDGLFSDLELVDILGDLLEPEPEADPGAQLDKAAELQQKWGTALGQVWEVGDHRIVCGDCTDGVVVEAVMQGEKAGAVVTDPPYGITNMEWDKPVLLEDEFWLVTWPVLSEQGVFIAFSVQPFTSKVIFAHLDKFRYELIWNKVMSSTIGLAKKRPLRTHENIIVLSDGDEVYHPPLGEASRPFGKLRGTTSSSIGSFGIDYRVGVGYPKTILTFARPNNLTGGGLHPTQKPVELLEFLLETYTGELDIVYDPFLGSGTTAVACQQLGRKCRGVEIEPKYVAVTLERLAGMGLEPGLVE